MKATHSGQSAEQPIEAPCEQAVNEADTVGVSGRTLSRRAILGIGAVAAVISKPGQVLAQDKVEMSKDYKSKIVLNLDTQKTPDLQGFGVKPKRGQVRDWLELEVQLDIDAAPEIEKKNGKIVSAVQVRYFLYFNAPTQEKRRILTADVTYVDVPVKEKVFAIAFVHPNTIKKLTDSYNVTPAAATFYGVEVSVDGKVIGIKSNNGEGEKAQFWKLPNAPAIEPSLLPKSKTPFAPFWGDRHIQERSTP